MPRKSRKKPQPDSPATEPTPVAEVLETLPIAKVIELAKAPEPTQTEDLVAAFEKQRAREQAVTDPAVVDALAEHLAARRRKSDIEPERPMPEPEQPGKYVVAELARRPNRLPVPAGFHPGPVFPPAGIRVNKSFDRRTAAIQFSEAKPLDRATEYDLMTKLQEAGFQYKTHSRQWERPAPEGMLPADNSLGAVELAKMVVAARSEGRGR